MNRQARRSLTSQDVVAPVVVVAILLIAAEVAVRTGALVHALPTPSSAFRALFEGMISGDLTQPLMETVSAYLRGLVLACGAGIILGIVIGSSRVLEAGTSVVIEFLRPIPSVAFIPLAIMYFGLGPTTRIAVAAYVAFWPVLLSTMHGVRSVEPLMLDVARVSKLGRIERLRRVVLPAALPGIAVGLRISVSIALLAVVTAEFVTGSAGLGAYMQLQQLAARLPEMYAAIILSGLLGLGFNILFSSVASRVVFWSGSRQETGT